MAAPLQKDRCGKACFDVTRKLTELLNAYFVALAAVPTVHCRRLFRSTRPSPPAAACHSTYTGAKMACGSCHDNTLTDGHMH